MADMAKASREVQDSWSLTMRLRDSGKPTTEAVDSMESVVDICRVWLGKCKARVAHVSIDAISKMSDL
jgi:hypothetical protein